MISYTQNIVDKIKSTLQCRPQYNDVVPYIRAEKQEEGPLKFLGLFNPEKSDLANHKNTYQKYQRRPRQNHNVNLGLKFY